MKMKRLELLKRICDEAGLVPNVKMYFSKRQLEQILLSFKTMKGDLQKVDKKKTDTIHA